MKGNVTGKHAVEDHVWDLTAFHYVPQHTLFAQYVPLPHHIVKTVRAYLVCQGLVHNVSSFVGNSEWNN